MMRFTKYNSMNDILAFPRMEEYLKIFYSEFLLEMFPEELNGEPIALAEQFGKTPWGEPFSIIADQLLDAANLVLDLVVNKRRRCIALWDVEDGDWSLDTEKEVGKGQTFLVAPVMEEEHPALKPAVIVCPGGGYHNVCFSGEGTPVMHYMENQGYRAFVLKYRANPCLYPAPQEDMALAIQYIRANAEKYGVDPTDVTLIGASAGGHLCAFEAVIHEEMAKSVYNQMKQASPALAEKYNAQSARPDKLVLSYPVISFCDQPHEGSFQMLTGGDESLREPFSVEKLVDKNFPPTFVWACEDDDCVPPHNAKIMGAALTAAQVRNELHIYPTGGHGCGLAYSKSAYPWSRAMVNFLKE